MPEKPVSKIVFCPKCGLKAEFAWKDKAKIGIFCKLHGAVEVLFTEYKDYDEVK